MTLVEAKQLKVDERLRRPSNPIIRVIREIVKRGVIVTKIDGTHKEFFEWSYLTNEKDPRGALYKL